MKIFDCVEPWPWKVNFVDQNNVILGYDLDQQCCESAGWFIAEEPNGDGATLANYSDSLFTGDDSALESFYFDTEYFVEDGYSGIFKITDGSKNLYIHIYNEHNGYYSHGFEFSKDAAIIHKGNI